MMSLSFAQFRRTSNCVIRVASAHRQSNPTRLRICSARRSSPARCSPSLVVPGSRVRRTSTATIPRQQRDCRSWIWPVSPSLRSRCDRPGASARRYFKNCLPGWPPICASNARTIFAVNRAEFDRSERCRTVWRTKFRGRYGHHANPAVLRMTHASPGGRITETILRLCGSG